MTELIEWFDLQWIGDQFANGDAVPFLIWSALAFSAGLLTGLHMRWREAETARRRIEALRDSQLRSILEEIYVSGQFATSVDADISYRLDGLSALGLVKADGGTTLYWRLTDQCRKAMDKMHR